MRMASAHMAEFQKVMADNPAASRDIRIYETDEGNPLATRGAAPRMRARTAQALHARARSQCRAI